MQGFGNVGAYAAEIYAEQGGKVIAVSDAFGAVRNEAGLDVKALRRHLAEGGDLASFPEGARPCMAEPAAALVAQPSCSRACLLPAAG